MQGQPHDTSPQQLPAIDPNAVKTDAGAENQGQTNVPSPQQSPPTGPNAGDTFREPENQEQYIFSSPPAREEALHEHTSNIIHETTESQTQSSVTFNDQVFNREYWNENADAIRNMGDDSSQTAASKHFCDARACASTVDDAPPLLFVHKMELLMLRNGHRSLMLLVM